MVEVSVIIPTYNSARFVAAAVESVLAQTFEDYEVLVIDDGSTDDTEAVMSRFAGRVRTIKTPNGGVSAARNRGIAGARGRWVAFLDADDTWSPHKLERQLAAVRGRPEYRACFSAYTRVDRDLVPIGVSRSTRGDVTLEDLLMRGNAVGSICTVIAERSLFDAAGGFDEGLSQCADWDMWVRLAVFTRFLYVDEPLVTYRQHDANMSRDPSLLERDSGRVLWKGFAMPQLPPALGAWRRRTLARNDVVLAGCHFHAGRYRDVARCLARRRIPRPRAVPVRRGVPAEVHESELAGRPRADGVTV